MRMRERKKKRKKGRKKETKKERKKERKRERKKEGQKERRTEGKKEGKDRKKERKRKMQSGPEQPRIQTGPLNRPFARPAHSFTCSGLPALLVPSAAFTLSFAHLLHSLPRSWNSE